MNTTPCEKCAGTGHTCYKSDVGLVCWDCKRLKIRCSFITAKGKGKQKATPPPKPTPAAPKPRPSPLSKAGPSPKAKPAPAPTPKGKGKVEDAPTLPAAPPRTAPGPLVTQRAYVDLPRSNLMRNGKRKAAEINVDSSEGERDDDANKDDDNDDKDAYMAGRVNGLHTFVAMFKTVFGALKKEVTEIDGYLVRKRRRHRR
ncbi:hypothetical protein BDR05DRAFT_950305 [Suillus weaverae]|nr:hypothetical protein BDR05DRAFT_950305 [Suillus weaverae]